MAPCSKKWVLQGIAVEVNMGMIDDEQCANLLHAIGATEDELDEVMSEEHYPPISPVCSGCSNPFCDECGR